ncbi:adenosylmethionine--8-amino-7-oxononanoate transaminase [Luteolibacter ambystomatis]|uniref:Adenosylmethionine-8-amino-7-oxononanoate aminotransferase n=1 Tax=Luteolibacter ambystomatis TaxID=2824561 RepID=A0A975G7G5_9BACT|nr:adenosylmethionine--8-amino-7-oxononanoate transaminase [Luteolibacter ambystomatis]QUE50727.1 adenosylmethionine--8-amino-7-oxononanoate transaminase [Luteolibacter ambystomatis]
MREDSRRWIEEDRSHCWHPFTRQADWCAEEPLVLVRGEGVWLWDSEGRRYFDGNSSIWTNIHGHRHPRLDAAIRAQLDEVAHTSFLGFANPRASELSARLSGLFPDGTLERVFFSDDGSTAIECAVRMALQYRLNRGENGRTGFVAFENGYHGDTLGAASLGGVGRFTGLMQRFGFGVKRVTDVAALEAMPESESAGIAAVILEPLIQGVNEMRLWPQGMLAALRRWCDARGIHLILDEVMTGFGRTGRMFACQHENVTPDFLCVAKGLTGGYMPMAATLTTSAVYDAFLGCAEKTFYYGHSYTANPLGCAVALAGLDVFEQERVLENLQPNIARMEELLAGLKERCPQVHEIRQCGFIAGIELRQPDGNRFPAETRTGETVCRTAWKHGLLTRPILDTIVLMPPLAATEEELAFAVAALEKAIGEGAR